MTAKDYFEIAEFDNRLASVRERMSDVGFDCLVITDPCNIYYLTGYDAWSFYTPQALLVFPDHKLMLVVREMDRAGALMTSVLSADQIVSYDEGLVQTPDGHPFEFVGKIISSILDSRNQRIALEMESYYLSIRAYNELLRLFPNAVFQDAKFLVNWVRFRKSPREQVLMREAGALLTRVMNDTTNAIYAGASEREAVAVSYASNIAGCDGSGGSYTSSPSFFLSGERIKTPHLPWSDKIIENDTQINLELMGNRLRYQCTMGRTVFVGEPSKKLYDLEKIVCDGIDEVLALIKPGVTCHEIADFFLNFLQKRGIEKNSRCGYSQGIAYPPTGGELTASIRRGDETVLSEGATMHFLPAIWSDNTSLIISEPFLVTESGVDLLCNVDRKVFIR